MELLKYLFLLVAPLFILTAGCIGGGDEDGATSKGTDDLVLELISHPIALEEGQTGSLDVPFIGINFLDTDVKHHWDMPANVTGVMVNVTCSPSSWNIELSIGTGDCPHSGKAMNTTNGNSGELSVQFWTRGNNSLELGQWFCHIAPEDASSHRGQSLQYVFEVTLFSYEEIDCEGDVCPA